MAGLLRCGRCGKKMRVHYGGRSGRSAAVVYYQCTASPGQPEGKQLCSLCGGLQVEQAVVGAVLASLAPVRMEALAQAAGQLADTRAQMRRQLELELERARFDAGRCQRQYDAAEPENRLVARTLERRWNEALEHAAALEQELSQLDPSPSVLSQQEVDDLHKLASDLPVLWNHEAAPFDLKKRIVRAVIKEIVVYVEAATLRLLVHWQGGQHTEINLSKRKAGEHRWKTADSTLSLIEQLARWMSDRQIAAQLNRMGIKSAKGHGWTRGRVGIFRTDNAIANYTPGERQARGELTIEETAKRLGVSYSTVQRMIKGRQLPAHQICAGAPWIICTRWRPSARQAAARADRSRNRILRQSQASRLRALSRRRGHRSFPDENKKPPNQRHCRAVLLNELYRIAFRRKLYSSIDELQADLDLRLEEFNRNRPHQGRWCFGKTPMETFLDAKPTAEEKMIAA
jgi:excisionase family DNA binding protein